MGERIAFTAWEFISLRCKEHQAELKLKEIRGKPCYCCDAEGCSFMLPALVYEKILDDTVKKLNSGKLAVGSQWRKKYCGRNYECTAVEMPTGKKPVIEIRSMIG